MKRTIVCVVALALVAVAAVSTPVARAVYDPGSGGEILSCSTGIQTTVSWNTVNTVDSPGYCLSNQTGFYAYTASPARLCQFFGFNAYVVSYPGNQIRFSANYCVDGLWHYSPASASNETRWSEMQIYQDGRTGVQWSMALWKR